MLRWTMSLLAVALAAECVMRPLAAADLPDTHRAAVYSKAPPRHGRTVDGPAESESLLTDGSLPSIHFPPLTPILPGSATLPGYYGSIHSYDDQGPYYGGRNLSVWARLPYSCGVFGYC